MPMLRQDRQYQLTAIDKLRQLWRTPINPDKPQKCHDSIVLVAPVGAGKTEMALMITERALSNPEFDVYFLGHRQELIDQPSRRYKEVGLRHDIIKASYPKVCQICFALNKYGEEKCSKCNQSLSYERIQVASVQTLFNRNPIKTGRSKAIVFIDEGHRCRARLYQKILESLKICYESVYFIYLTATPYRLDGQGLSDMASALIEAATPKQLIAGGFILNPTVYTRPTPQLDPHAVLAGEFAEDEVFAKYEDMKLYADIVDTWKKYHHGFPGIGFGINKAHCEHLEERFKAAGLRTAYINAETAPGLRRRALARLAIGGPSSSHPQALDLIINKDLFTEGFDSRSSYELLFEPEMKDLWLGRSYPPPFNPLAVIGDWAPTLSMGKFIQRHRNTRTDPKKTGAWFLSHAGGIERHCFLEQHEGFTLTQNKETNPIKKRIIREQNGVALKVCLMCGASNRPAAQQCLECKASVFEIVKHEEDIIEEAEGELVETKADPKKQRPFTSDEAEAWLRKQYQQWQNDNHALIEAGKAPRKAGWVAHRYKGIQGVFPNFDITYKIKKELGIL